MKYGYYDNVFSHTANDVPKIPYAKAQFPLWLFRNFWCFCPLYARQIAKSLERTRCVINVRMLLSPHFLLKIDGMASTALRSLASCLCSSSPSASWSSALFTICDEMLTLTDFFWSFPGHWARYGIGRNLCEKTLRQCVSYSHGIFAQTACSHWDNYGWLLHHQTV